MKSRSVVCRILSIMIILSVFAGCQAEPAVETDPPVTGTLTQTQEPATEQTVSQEPTIGQTASQPEEKVFPFGEDEELLLAYEVGFVPETLWDDLTANVTLADFCAML